MSSSRTTLVSAIDPSSSPPSTGIKLDSTLTEEDQETMIEDAMKVRLPHGFTNFLYIPKKFRENT